MADIAAKIIKHNKAIVIVFMVLTMVSAVAQFFVHVNYNMSDYMPENTSSTIAVEIMEEEFGGAMSNAQVMVTDVTVQEALYYKDRLEKIDGVTDVIWLDDTVDLTIPLEMMEQDLIETYYQDHNALFSLTIREGDEVVITDEIYELIGEENALVGEAADTAVSQKMAFTESMYAAMLLVPIIIIILVISTNSWIEPLFFLTAIGVSIIINLGTNIFIGEISFVTQSVSPILQLAVSLDYAIFLLHSFSEHRRKTSSPEEAMQMAIKKSTPAIAASAATTFFGFMALTFMQFEIGADLGINLVKGIVFSFISVMVFLPALTIMFYKWIDKTQHKPFIPAFRSIGKRVLKVRYISLIIVFLVIVPAYLAQQETAFIYGIGEQPEDTRLGKDETAINAVFGKSTPVVLLVPRGDVAREVQLEQELEEIEYVSGIISYNQSVSPAIPPEYLDESIREQFHSENYSRIIINTETESEGDIAFNVFENIMAVAKTYYGKEAFALGESAALYDMKTVIQKDNYIVNILTVVAVGLVLLFTFRSLALPVILLLTIQSAVWINLAVPYFTDTPLVFVGYLVVGTVQLAATVDYAILYTENYLHNRKVMPARQAIMKTIDDKTFSISISAAILASVGLILWITSTNPIVSSIGLLLGRGAILAFIMVLFFLPAVLLVFDKIVSKTTLKANFYKED
ncbi:efflux RND transporter permease subunit [Alkalihalobacterium chitinilyticum]|uniref:MMPL family transporter n=1 Tax=Alkalihalobacterium chitinilyticum TaxID=2980103 RepID=A0ABT5VER3_9BACI|nr:MMPL family transporter [Alkalihalobacterium chitinilyticum]MDE5413187.1 MMPL family transporter [Alkalihalobacterium chitinilyticum]